MSTNNRASTANGISATAPEKSFFEQQREILVGEIAQSLEHVLQNINKLNRSLEEVIAVGNEFSPVEALWSQFENVMAKDSEENVDGGEGLPEGDSDVTELGK
ncbi:DASH complex subunit Dad1 [Lindgomyces ingoldianus]|uniref:DASH complex subunit Dad1 n=1 Tax=Lindgomyces ingoldianus TaxID=673940 RepID=A0ACB6R3X8_9PLEO|nr:DASH complex subunit Dad1 [Lindgomyces ingoldianus]KAF2473846.1 DASH complex subunit Dad1 [Lindgomyces ingoldianus]